MPAIDTATALFDPAKLIGNPNRQRLRERYIATRFAQFPNPRSALRHTEEVQRWALQLQDDGESALAVELLQLALEEDPSQQPLWLHLLELVFLDGDTATFISLVDAYRQRFGNDPANTAIDAMGHDLAPKDDRFRHVNAPVMLPHWSTPATAGRNEGAQRTLHIALQDLMAYYQGK
ncbi:MAG: hypothetical protein JNM52_05555 [Betaproteobacteria bacterium]|nr:hypothetical protein [Betaproteobacteria bacterium]